ncbi:unnamed protein product [Heligmosomoides polygyrus]|uniref:DUF1758 domain-containing protein n=1 Tax=Heligmosomoides polygyrus TaxID=6339 RepID=A0A183GE84_HELPZ|nr:unnamed protein product [Heligmosomoides polygyrus]
MLVNVNVYNARTRSYEALTIFLDSGSQPSFITASAVYRLGLSVSNRQSITLVTLGGHASSEPSGIVDKDRSGKEVFSAYHSAKCAGTPSDKEGDHKLNEEVNRLWSLKAIGITDDPDPEFDAKENERIVKEFNETAKVINGYLHRNIIDRRLIPRIFGQPQDIAKIASGLAQFGVSPLKIDTLYTDANTTLCYAPKPMRYPHAAVVLPPSLGGPHCGRITDPPRLSSLARLNDLLREAPQLDQGKNSLSVDGPSTVSSWSTLLIRHARRSSRFDSTQGTEKLQPRKDPSPKRPECRDDHD